MSVIDRRPWDELTAVPFGAVMGEVLTDEAAMRLAVKLAWCGAGTAQPNPLVGAVFLDEHGKLQGYGYHEQFGSHHAEINALNMVKSFASIESLDRGSLHVTLEPCAHHGQTPPCAEQLAKLPLKRVVIGATDPTSKVNGKGVSLLREAGMEVLESPDCRDDCQQLIERFVAAQIENRCLVGLKAACTLDGCIADRGDRRQWITGTRARAYGHFLRLVYDGVMVGAETVVSDNPTLLPTASGKPEVTPWRIVVDPTGRAATCRLPQEQNLWRKHPEKVIWILDRRRVMGEAETRLVDAGVVVMWGEPLGQRMCPKDILRKLFAYGLHSVLLEGGAGLYGAFLEYGLVDRWHLFQAPKLHLGLEPIRWFDHCSSASQMKLDGLAVIRLGVDLLIEGKIAENKT